MRSIVGSERCIRDRVDGDAEREGCIEAPIGRNPTQKTRMAVTKGGRSAKSVWRRLYADPEGRFSLLAVRIFSGRTHQIRVHMQHIGHALLGDAVYKPLPGQAGQSTLSDFTSATEDAVSGFGSALPVPASRQMLHAWKLQFRPLLPEKAGCSLPADPKDCDPPLVSFTCPPPSDFTDCLEKLMTRTLKVIVTGSPGCGKSALTEFLKSREVPVFRAVA